jgi:hypothetical protein
MLCPQPVFAVYEALNMATVNFRSPAGHLGRALAQLFFSGDFFAYFSQVGGMCGNLVSLNRHLQFTVKKAMFEKWPFQIERGRF